MAEQPIRKEDIIQSDEIIKSLRDIIAVLDTELKKAIEENIKSVKGLSDAIIHFNANVKAGQDAIAAGADQTKKLTHEQRELAKLNAQLQAEMKRVVVLESEQHQVRIKAVAELKKQNQEKTKEITQGKAAADSYLVLVANLKKLRDAWKLAGEAGRKDLAPQIDKIDKQLKNLDKSIGQHQRNVGNYGSAFSEAGIEIGDMAKAAFSAGAVIGVLTTVVQGIKEAIMTTTFAIDAGNQVSQAWKQVLYDISVNGGIAADSLKQVYAAQKALNEIRLESIMFSIQDAKYSREMAALRLLSSDATATDAERIEALNKVREIDATQTKERLGLLAKELDGIAKLREARPADEKLLKRQSELIVQMIKEQEMSDMKMKEVESRRSGLIKKQTDERAKMWDDYVKGVQKTQEEDAKAQAEIDRKAEEARQKVIDDRAKAGLAAREAFSKEQSKIITEQKQVDDEITVGAQELSNKLIEIKKQEVQQINDLEATKEQFTKETNKAILRDKIAAMEDEFQILSDASQVLGDIFAAQKQRELNAAGDNAQKREEIERDYFKKEQALAIAQAVINGALAVTKVTAQTGVLSPFAIPLIVATTLGQIALISSQKFAEGGYTGDGSYRDETGQKVAGIVHEKEFVLDRDSTKKYRPLIEAIHEDDPAKIAAIVSNEHMHNIWGNMNKAIGSSQDPYTRLMYDLMKSQPSIYVDSDGNTVLQYIGRKQVIRKN